MKISALFLTACLFSYMLATATAFGCTNEMCSVFPFFSPVCCFLAHTCCSDLAKKLEAKPPLPECESNSVQVTASTTPKPARIIRFYPYPLPPTRWM